MTTNLDPSTFPYVFKCGCGQTTEITHEDATEAVPPEINATTRQAVNRALRSKDWDAAEGQTRCPACVEDAA
jgi:hypothetical protein